MAWFPASSRAGNTPCSSPLTMGHRPGWEISAQGVSAYSFLLLHSLLPGVELLHFAVSSPLGPFLKLGNVSRLQPMRCHSRGLGIQVSDGGNWIVGQRSGFGARTDGWLSVGSPFLMSGSLIRHFRAFK